MSKQKDKFMLLLVIMILLLSSKCSAPTSELVTKEVPRVVKETVVVEKEIVATVEVVEQEVVAEEQAVLSTPAAMDYPAPAVYSDREEQVASGIAAPSFGRKIIKNAKLDLLVASTDVAVDRITGIIIDHRGYILSTTVWYDDAGYKEATITLGVPVDSFEEVLRRLRDIAIQVQNETASGQDVTDQYVDLESQLRNLEATEARVREFLNKAETVEEALRVNQELSEIERQIEEIKGQMNYLKDRAAFSTITVNLFPQRPTPTTTATPTVTATPTATPTSTPWRPGDTFQQASGTLNRLFIFLADTLIWLVVLATPFVLPVLVLILIIVQWQNRRRVQKQRMKSKQEDEKTTPEEPRTAE